MVEYYQVSRAVSNSQKSGSYERDNKGVEALLQLGDTQNPDANDQHIVKLVDWVLQFAFEQGIFEIGVCYEPTHSEQLTFQLLFKEDFVALVPKDHALAKRKSVSMAELCSYPFVTLQKPSIIRHVIEQNCLENNLVLDLKVECHQISSLSHFVAYGMGVTAIPRHFHKFIDKEHNVLLEIDEGNVHLPLGVIYKKDFELSNISAQFIETLLKHRF